jgi:hypothetical protein
MARGSPRRPARGAASADRATGWRKHEGAGPAAARSLAPRPAARSRSRPRSAGKSDAEAEMSAALETADALSSARGAGERQAAEAVRDTSWGHSRRVLRGRAWRRQITGQQQSI